MPFDWAREAVSCGFDLCAAITGVQHQCLYVTVEPDRSVNLRLDVTVHGIQLVRLSELDERAAVGYAEVGRLGGTVGVAERGATEGLDAEPEVRGAEPR